MMSALSWSSLIECQRSPLSPERPELDVSDATRKFEGDFPEFVGELRNRLPLFCRRGLTAVSGSCERNRARGVFRCRIVGLSARCARSPSSRRIVSRSDRT